MVASFALHVQGRCAGALRCVHAGSARLAAAAAAIASALPCRAPLLRAAPPW